MSKKILANDGIDAQGKALLEKAGFTFGIDAQGKALLEKAGFTVVTEKVAQEKLAQSINQNNYIGLTVRSATKVRKDLIDACPGLELIGRGGVGMDNIDVD